MNKIRFHAVMIGEDGMEFGADVWARNKEQADTILRESYPESRIDQLESPEEANEREMRMYRHIAAGGDWDDEGRPIFHYPPDEDDDDLYSG